jgi:hypothetical protein
MSRFHFVFGALALAFASTAVLAQGVVVHEDFESGAPGWTMTGFCHIEPQASACGALVAPFPSPGHAIWFGTPATCDYSGPPGLGQLDAPNPIQLPVGPGQVVLRYARFRETEPCSDGYDVSVIEVRHPGAPLQLVWAYDCGFESGWSHRRIDLSPWAGTSVEIHIHFWTGDNQYNDTRGYWLDDIEVVREPGTVTCTADSSCPCINQSLAAGGFEGPANTGGCVHSRGNEVRLVADGVQSVANDTVDLAVNDLPPATALIYVQGSTSQSVPFGDGKRCFGGAAVRLAVHSVQGGADTYPHAGETGIAQKGALPLVGGTRTYQVVYRDAASYCTSSTFNSSNGYVITWQP